MNNGQFTLGDIFGKGFELFRKKYKQLIIIACALFAVTTAATLIVQYIFFPAIYCTGIAFEFSLFGLMARSFIGGSPDWEYDYSDDGTGGFWSDYGNGNGLNAFPQMDAIAVWGFFILAVLMIIVLITIIAITVSIVTGTFSVGARQASLVLAENGKPSFDYSFGYFAKHWKRFLGVTAWSMLWTLLWGLLFCVPGIIKSYSYRLAPYLVIQYPEMTVRQALKKSMEITNGHKGKLFVLDLGIIACSVAASIAASVLMYLSGIAASLLLVTPLSLALYAVAYLFIRQAAINNGMLKPVQSGCEPVKTDSTNDGIPVTEDNAPLAADNYEAIHTPQAEDESDSPFSGLEEDSPKL